MQDRQYYLQQYQDRRHYQDPHKLRHWKKKEPDHTMYRNNYQTAVNELLW